jgi:HSP20 family protein
MKYAHAKNHSDHRPRSPFGWSPSIDIAESDDEYLISMDLPCVSKESLDVIWRDHTISVSGVRSPGKGAGEGVSSERAFGRFYRAFSVPRAVRVDQIEASFRDGILTIKAPKLDKETPFRIEVR